MNATGRPPMRAVGSYRSWYLSRYADEKDQHEESVVVDFVDDAVVASAHLQAPRSAVSRLDDDPLAGQ